LVTARLTVGLCLCYRREDLAPVPYSGSTGEGISLEREMGCGRGARFIFLKLFNLLYLNLLTRSCSWQSSFQFLLSMWRWLPIVDHRSNLFQLT